MKHAFLCHSSSDWEFVAQVAAHLKRSAIDTFCFEDHQSPGTAFPEEIGKALQRCEVFIAFVGADFHSRAWTALEASNALARNRDEHNPVIIVVHLFDRNGKTYDLPACLELARTMLRLSLEHQEAIGQRGRLLNPSEYAVWVALQITRRLGVLWQSADDLPVNPHLFDYEKTIIKFYKDISRLGPRLFQEPHDLEAEERRLEGQLRAEMRKKLLEGVPPHWPQIRRCEPSVSHGDGQKVVAAALSMYHQDCDCSQWSETGCMLQQGFCFHEAVPREEGLCFPRGGRLKVAIMASGGIAPGMNAVIDGIVQRHWTCGFDKSNSLEIYGLRNGFRAFDALNDAAIPLARYQAHGPPESVIRPDSLSSQYSSARHANEGGCFLGTSRNDKLLLSDKRLAKLENIVHQLTDWSIDILYVIGGDGSMKAAHALWSVARDMRLRGDVDRELSVVAIPKTMDNDILWMWQSFGFMSAVEKARELIENLHTEVSSNPRLCVMQLFGSDSGFVVSHAVLATATGQCDAALIPEVDFSMKGLARHLKTRMLERSPIPYGLVVMAETAIPTDALDYYKNSEIDLTASERRTIEEFCKMRDRREHIQGQTKDELRSAGLKIVSRGLDILLREPLDAGDKVPEPWKDKEAFRVVTNEPRHHLRSTRPSCQDVIMGQRLGTLAVDNALAGYTDFMISQWLTEYVLVPLKLVVLGRKRIPDTGMFWKSVLAKTGQKSLA